MFPPLRPAALAPHTALTGDSSVLRLFPQATGASRIRTSFGPTAAPDPSGGALLPRHPHPPFPLVPRYHQDNHPNGSVPACPCSMAGRMGTGMAGVPENPSFARLGEDGPGEAALLRQQETHQLLRLLLRIICKVPEERGAATFTLIAEDKGFTHPERRSSRKPSPGGLRLEPGQTPRRWGSFLCTNSARKATRFCFAKAGKRP